MIQAHELRIGNCVTGQEALSTGKSYTTVHSIDEEGRINVCRIEGDYEGCLSDVEPIPLTTDILEACKLIDPENRMLHFGQLFNKETGELFVQWRQAPVKYLHVLQNVYYYQMDKELEVNLPANQTT